MLWVVNLVPQSAAGLLWTRASAEAPDYPTFCRLKLTWPGMVLSIGLFPLSRGRSQQFSVSRTATSVRLGICYVCVRLCMRVREGGKGRDTCAPTNVWRSEDSLWCGSLPSALFVAGSVCCSLCARQASCCQLLGNPLSLSHLTVRVWGLQMVHYCVWLYLSSSTSNPGCQACSTNTLPPERSLQPSPPLRLTLSKHNAVVLLGSDR